MRANAIGDGPAAVPGSRRSLLSNAFGVPTDLKIAPHWTMVGEQVAPIASSRLVLQPVTPEIARAVVSGRISEIPAVPGWPHDDTVDAMAGALLPESGPGWLITLDGMVIGDCGAFSWPGESGTVEIGYGLAEQHRGRGFGTEAARAMCDWLFAQAGATEITATGVGASNIASRRVLEKLGFTDHSEDRGRVSSRLEPTSPRAGSANPSRTRAHQ